MPSSRIALIAQSQWTLWLSHDESDRAAVGKALLESPEEVAKGFYDHLLAHPKAAQFLDPDMVEGRLKASLAAWLRQVGAIGSLEALSACLDQNLKVGLVHARIGIPMHLVTDAFQVVRRSVAQRLLVSEPEDRRATRVMLLVDWLEPLVQVMNQAYLDDLLDNTRQRQALRTALLGPQLMVQLERLKNQVQEWLRRLLLDLVVHQRETTAFERADLLQWLDHKAPFIGAPDEQLAELRQQIDHVAALQEQVQAEPRAHAEALDQAAARLLRLLDRLIELISENELGLDPLTEVLNRRFLTPVLQREVNLARRFGRSFVALMLDLDHFKAVNDQHGHLVGDQVLGGVAQVLLRLTRPGDFVFRYGGEEFLVVLTDIPASVALQRAEGLRRGIAAIELRAPDGRLIQQTASIGMARFDGHPDFARLVDRADQALLKAKADGRNRVVVAHP